MCDVFTQLYVFIKNLIPLCPSPLLYCRFTDSAPHLAEMPHPQNLLSSSCLHPQSVTVPAGAATPAGQSHRGLGGGRSRHRVALR